MRTTRAAATQGAGWCGVVDFGAAEHMAGHDMGMEDWASSLRHLFFLTLELQQLVGVRGSVGCLI